jgi:hypothetical protein
MLEEDGTHKIICTTLFRKPWVALFKIVNDKKLALPSMSKMGGSKILPKL